MLRSRASLRPSAWALFSARASSRRCCMSCCTDDTVPCNNAIIMLVKQKQVSIILYHYYINVYDNIEAAVPSIPLSHPGAVVTANSDGAWIQIAQQAWKVARKHISLCSGANAMHTGSIQAARNGQSETGPPTWLNNRQRLGDCDADANNAGDFAICPGNLCPSHMAKPHKS